MKLNNVFENLYTLYCENKLAHAYLLETNDIQKCLIDLKTFINHSIKEKFLEKVSQKWIITSTIFSDKEIAFNKDSIRSTKETISKENIKKLVDNCML